MRTSVVCDASAVVALLLDAGPDGRWATNALTGARLAAPSLLAFEAANIIRRHEVAERIEADQAAQAHADLLDLAIELWPYEPLASRAWELRRNLTSYDASYAALAELLDVTLVTLDCRLARAPELRCTVVTPKTILARTTSRAVPVLHARRQLPLPKEARRLVGQDALRGVTLDAPSRSLAFADPIKAADRRPHPAR